MGGPRLLSLEKVVNLIKCACFPPSSQQHRQCLILVLLLTMSAERFDNIFFCWVGEGGGIINLGPGLKINGEIDCWPRHSATWWIGRAHIALLHSSNLITLREREGKNKGGSLIHPHELDLSSCAKSSNEHHWKKNASVTPWFFVTRTTCSPDLFVCSLSLLFLDNRTSPRSN